MAKEQSTIYQRMNSALDRELPEQEWAALNAQLESSPDDAARWERLRKTDEFLRTTPLVGPASGFVARVMAAIAAMPLPDFAQRHPSVGIALGLMAVALLAVPILSVLTVVLVSSLTDPGVVNGLLQAMVNAAGYVIGLLGDVAGRLEHAVRDRSTLFAVLAVVIPVTVLWVWLIGYLLGGFRLLARRSKT